MSRGWKIAIAVVLFLIVAYMALVVALIAGTTGGGGGGLGFGAGTGAIAVIRLDGVISADPSGGTFGSTGIDPVRTAELLNQAEEDEGIAAVVLRVNSPGGSPAASWEIYSAIQGMSKPVVVSVGDVAASGAYYFASAADSIVAAPTSSVGSIGVILMAADLEKLFDKVGVRYTVLTKGKHKDIGAPNREMSEEEKNILLLQMDAIYEQFIEDVAEGRQELEVEQVRALATGLTYPGAEALKLGLVDKLGSYDDALDEAARSAGLDVNDYGVRYLQDDFGFSFLELLLGAQAKEAVHGFARELASAISEGVGTGAARPELR